MPNLWNALLPLSLTAALAAAPVPSAAATGLQRNDASPTGPFRIALVSDPHVTRGTAEDQPLYKGRFEKVIADVNAARVDLVLIAGDLTQSGKPDEIDDFRRQASGFAAPVRYVFGNHDVGAKHLPGKEGGTTAERTAHIEEGLGPSFFVDIRSGGRVRIVGVNGSLFGSGLVREADQWAFLETEMTAQAAPNATTLLLSHYPPFLSRTDEPGGDYWNIEPDPRRRLLGLLKKGNVRAVLSGHLHRPLRAEKDGIAYITTHPVSFGLPRQKQPQGWTLVTIGQDRSILAEGKDVPD